MTTDAASITSTLAQEKMYASQKALQQKQKEEEKTQSETSEHMSSVVWEASDNKDGTKTYKIGFQDVVYMSAISSSMAEDEIESLSRNKSLKFRERTIEVLKNKFIKLAMDSYSHNFFVSQLSKMGIGIVSFQMGLLGVSGIEIQGLLSDARRKKIEVIKTSLQQVASEKVLFGIVTGAKVV
ncbi:hypothetical protein A2230_05120 [candidate division WOR-1 bacterium RIFOXYA2_FULL_36_21]|uniref:Uncharacterized protein n=1 Tax=candidate division WOR-1 bacterium RIFOXYB2_FULL_36_35 TaxID=1802578 RepID=A0A1F4S5S0_UNCSA|nr:MAG: hypothetical protein A2230_05120 [candidate division WOR-1 bacterium RIFOXYA2_FULL_36_21]OGC15785.1 MAG: hypothetical protein A2290_05545 [candidate division WOR-1 bacterium RIFOXYB2_FULL_36_35]OGC16694.1 MAG: hypothetical protein A2282_06015 [candidate division WOR-1 bacterium RIFOXYA12_FULL_36_13]